MESDSRRILLVDDSPDLRELVARYLSKAGWHVTSSENGVAAISLLGAGEYDFLITDFDMPGLSGLALIDWVRRCRCRVRTILLSGSPLSAILPPDLLASPDVYMAKPVDLKGLHEALLSLRNVLPKAGQSITGPPDVEREEGEE